MAEERIVRVGTRKSQLALVQTNSVIQMLKVLDPTLKFETVPMSTVGDRILDSALSKIGEKSLFTKELETALLKKQVDFVVHSLKDLPTTLPDNLTIGCVCRRDNPYDAVINHPKHMRKRLNELPPGSVIGTSSLRRAAQIKRAYPQHKIENIRGNLNTRFKKLAEQNVYDSIVLAVAGLERMGWDHCIAQILDANECMYAVSQGAMAVECRDGDEATLSLLNKIHDHQTTLEVIAERAYLWKLEGGCSVPVAVYTELAKGQVCISGGVFSIDGSEVVKHTLTKDLDKPECDDVDSKMFVGIYCQTADKRNEYVCAHEAGIKLAEEMISNGADKILAAAKATSRQEIIEEHERKQKEEQEKQDQGQEGGDRKRKAEEDPEISSSHDNSKMWKCPYLEGDPMKQYIMAQHHDMSLNDPARMAQLHRRLSMTGAAGATPDDNQPGTSGSSSFKQTNL